MEKIYYALLFLILTLAYIYVDGLVAKNVGLEPNYNFVPSVEEREIR